MDAAGWDRRYAEKELVWSAGPNRFVVEQLAEAPPGRALDVAAGEGRNAAWLAEGGWRVTALDFSAVGVDKGRRLSAARGVDVDWVLGDATTWEPPAEAFDLVLIAYLHLPAADRAAVLRHAADALAPGGTLLIVGHDPDGVGKGVGGPQDREVLADAPQLATELAALGLVVDTAAQVQRETVDDEGRPAVAPDCLVRAHRPGR